MNKMNKINKSVLKNISFSLKNQLGLKDLLIVEMVSIQSFIGKSFSIRFVFNNNKHIQIQIKNIVFIDEFEEQLIKAFHDNKKLQRAIKLNKIYKES